MLRVLVVIISFLVIVACAKAKQAETLTPPIPDDGAEALPSQNQNGFFGTWYVSEVFPLASKGSNVTDPHLGSALVISPSEVSDVNGQRCSAPVFTLDNTAPPKLGMRPAQDVKWERLTVSCNAQAFATYLRVSGNHDDGPALLQQRPEAFYLLEQAAALQHRYPTELAPISPQIETNASSEKTPIKDVPAVKKSAEALPAIKVEAKQSEIKASDTKPAQPSSAPVDIPAPMIEGPVDVTQSDTVESPETNIGGDRQTADTLPAAGTAMHLASYKSVSAAKRGWKLLLGDYDELDPLSPLYVTVDVPGKGKIIRLYATGAEPAEIVKICAALEAKQVYCSLRP